MLLVMATVSLLMPLTIPLTCLQENGSPQWLAHFLGCQWSSILNKGGIWMVESPDRPELDWLFMTVRLDPLLTSLATTLCQIHWQKQPSSNCIWRDNQLRIPPIAPMIGLTPTTPIMSQMDGVIHFNNARGFAVIRQLWIHVIVSIRSSWTVTVALGTVLVIWHLDVSIWKCTAFFFILIYAPEWATIYNPSRSKYKLYKNLPVFLDYTIICHRSKIYTSLIICQCPWKVLIFVAASGIALVVLKL
jgi:hypothetical protein